jgi:catabolite regulation protein CreA
MHLLLDRHLPADFRKVTCKILNFVRNSILDIYNWALLAAAASSSCLRVSSAFAASSTSPSMQELVFELFPVG